MGDDGGLESIARLAHLPPVAAVSCIGPRAQARQPRRASRPRRDAAPFVREALMTAAAFARASGLALALCCTSVTAPAQTQAPSPESTWQPSVWQAGKDVVWLPTSQALVETMLDMAKVAPGDFVIDLGSGDGRLVIAAAKRGARALGIEYNKDMVALSLRNAEREGVQDRAQFAAQDLYEADLSRASVITMFLLPEINLKLRPRLLELAPGTRIVSNTFGMGDWQPDAAVELDPQTGCSGSWCTALLWIVPARVGGTHDVGRGRLSIEQKFQTVSGTLLQDDGQVVPVEGRVVGSELFLHAGDRDMRGTVDGERLDLR